MRGICLTNNVCESLGDVALQMSVDDVPSIRKLKRDDTHLPLTWPSPSTTWRMHKCGIGARFRTTFFVIELQARRASKAAIFCKAAWSRSSSLRRGIGATGEEIEDTL